MSQSFFFTITIGAAHGPLAGSMMPLLSILSSIFLTSPRRWNGSLLGACFYWSGRSSVYRVTHQIGATNVICTLRKYVGEFVK